MSAMQMSTDPAGGGTLQIDTTIPGSVESVDSAVDWISDQWNKAFG